MRKQRNSKRGLTKVGKINRTKERHEGNRLKMSKCGEDVGSQRERTARGKSIN